MRSSNFVLVMSLYVLSFGGLVEGILGIFSVILFIGWGIYSRFHPIKVPSVHDKKDAKGVDTS